MLSMRSARIRSKSRVSCGALTARTMGAALDSDSAMIGTL